MRFLFTSAQLVGHLDWGGYAATAAELRARGHEVLWASGKEVQPILDALDVPFVELQETGWRWPPPPPLHRDPGADPETYQRLRMVRSLDQWLEEDRVEKATTQLIQVGRQFRPDILVSEMFIAAAGIAAEVLDVPFVVAGWPALRTKVPASARYIAQMAQDRLSRLLSRFGATGVNWITDGPPALLSPLLHLTYWSPGWFTGLPLLPQNRHVGGLPGEIAPLTAPWQSHLQKTDAPWVFVTLGTTFTNDLNFFVAAAHGIHQAGGVPILAVGDRVSKSFMQQLQARLPRPTVVTNRVQFAQVLPRVRAAIHHGGAGTTHALVRYAVPQIVVPHAADQGRQAAGVVRSGVGMHIPPQKMTIQALTAALTELLPEDSDYRLNAKELQDEFASLGGTPAAAELLEETARDARR
jgi:UDP:flavonoid glycosyltransferase YjiC (YdhE family)